MTHVSKIVDDILIHLRLGSMTKTKGSVNVYLAKQNFNPVIDFLAIKMSAHFWVSFSNLEDITQYCKDILKVEFSVYQKPYSHGDENHLSLQVGGCYAIIFDYEDSV